MSGPTVCMVIVTFNRLEHLKVLLDCVQTLTRKPDHVVVVDNASTDGTPDYLRQFVESIHPMASLVEVVRTPENVGFAGGLNRGLGVAADRGDTFAWLSDDDSRPAPEFLERQLAFAAQVPDLGVLGDLGKVIRWGVPRDLNQLPPAALQPRQIAPGLTRCDWTLVDGALVNVAAAVSVGLLRDDFFMMCEDMEFTSRVGRAGWVIAAARSSDTARLHLGSEERDRPWRAYYQTRNELLTARARRSPSAIFGWAIRLAKFLVAAALAGHRPAVRMRLLGALHGLRGVSGKTVEPAVSGD